MINKNLIIEAKNIKSKKELFNIIAKSLYKEGIVKNIQNIVNDLEEREKLGSTAFENGLMIPHTRTKNIKTINIVIVKFNDLNFNSIDKKKTNFAVAILVPDNAGDEHLKILSKLSMIFSNKKKLFAFKKLSKKDKVLKIKSIVNKKEKELKTEKLMKSYDFVAITSCAAGIAHTYMARDALMDAANKMKLTCKIETRGAITENKLTFTEIDKAKFVIIAADVEISKKQFLGKKIYSVDTNTVIRNGIESIKMAQKEKITYGKGGTVGKLKLGDTKKGNKNSIVKHIMYALSFMIPIAIVGGLLMAIPNAIASGGNSKGGTWHFPNNFVHALWDFGHLGLILMVPILAMFLAYKIGGKPAIPAALIGGFFINSASLMSNYSIITLPSKINDQVSAGFLGGLAVGIIAGYLVKYMQWINWHKFIKPVAPLMIVPLVSSFIIFLIVVYVIGSPMTWIMVELFHGLSAINSGGIWASIGVGMLFAALMAIDLGGPINKTTLVVATVIFTQTLVSGNPSAGPQTAVQAAISIPPLGMWLSTIIFRRKFSITEIAAGQAALPMGLVGITEGSLPFAFRTPLKAIMANVSGAIVAGGLVSLFQIKFYGGLGSPLGAYIGYMQNSFYGLAWIFSISIGVIVTALLYGILRKKVPENEKIHRENKNNKKAIYLKNGLDTRIKIFRKNMNNFFKKLWYIITHIIISKYLFKNIWHYVINTKKNIRLFKRPVDWNDE